MRCIKRSIGVGNLPLNWLGALDSRRINVGGPCCFPVFESSGGSARNISVSTDFFDLKIITSLVDSVIEIYSNQTSPAGVFGLRSNVNSL